MRMQVTLVPHDYDLLKAMSQFDGLFLSNGPGDPTMAGLYCCFSTVTPLNCAAALCSCVRMQLLQLLSQCTLQA
jgi:carbamoylphosphate synthase small subunit